MDRQVPTDTNGRTEGKDTVMKWVLRIPGKGHKNLGDNN